MAVLEKMAICGVRSYSPSEFSIIEFQAPLTLLVGANGSGKTTVIECLKYATTGDMPPGCKNSAFIHDPKIAGEKEVKGQVKLRFTDITGTRYTIARSMVSSQKVKKVETKSLESVITRTLNGEKQSLTSRCADMNREMVTRLGVSKAVLENVIFCHQEDANWPLSEGKILKQKFDDLFAATRYIKALENIRALRRDQTHIVKECQIELNFLKERKVEAEQLRIDLIEKQTKMEVIYDEIKKKEKEMAPMEEKLAEIESVETEVIRIEKEIGNKESTFELIQKNGKELEERIADKFTGSYDDLVQISDRFREEISREEVKIHQIEAKVNRCSQAIQELSGRRAELLTKQGKLAQEAESHEIKITSRDELISKMIKQYSLSELPDTPYSPEDVDNFLSNLKMHYRQIVDEAEKTKNVFIKQLEEISTGMNRVTKSYHDYESTIKHKRNTMEQNKQTIREINQELGVVAASANRLQSIERDIRKSEKELNDLQGQVSTNQFNDDIKSLASEKKGVDQTLGRLREEQNRMHLQSTVQTKIDMKVKEKQAKEDTIQSIINRHEMDMSTIFGNRPPLEELKSQLRDYLTMKKSDLRSMNEKIKVIEKKLASNEANRKTNMEAMRKMESQQAEYKERLIEACGENSYNEFKEKVTKNLDKYKNIVSEINAFEKIYRKYIIEMKGSNKQDKGCPLCHREFASARELHQLVTELEHKLVSVPEKRQQNETILDQEKRKLSVVDELAPLNANLESLESKDIPEVRLKISDLGKEVESLRQELNDLEDVRLMTETEERTARDMQPDINMVDSYLYEIRDIDKAISLESSKLKGIAPGRTMTLITAEIEEAQEQIESIERKMELKRNQLMEHNKQCSLLERSINSLKSEQLALSAKLQRRSQLEEQKAELSSNNQSFEREIREAENQLEPLQKSLSEFKEKKRLTEDKKEKHAEDVRSLLEAIKQSGNRVRELDAEIKRYLANGRDKALQQNADAVKETEAENSRFEREKEKYAKELAEARKLVDTQQARARELEDNVRLFQAEEDMAKIRSELARLRKELSKYGASGLLGTNKVELQRDLDELRNSKASCEGRLKGLEEEQRKMERDLRSEKFACADTNYSKKAIESKTTEMANQDLDKYYKALDGAIMKFHTIKMGEINRILKEYWIHTYKGNDIDTIEIRADEDTGSGAAKARRVYNYRVVMIKGKTSLDMRSRCSAGQKVLASILIRLALAETFCLNCGILALDEPTTNLDEQNVESLANALKDIITTRQQQRNFQLVVITHDEEFVRALGQSNYVDYYYRVYKDSTTGHSKLHRQMANEIKE
ncbi:DNA repair protein RAD50-like [Rhopilema esculentum]|uniref:DNA repair protein RAD50-like n=1 Tax=Rhopilema esculentum TaxID=499914 RepID=UPI0031E2FD73